MALLRYVLIAVLASGLAHAQDNGYAELDAAGDAERTQAHRALLRDAASQVVDGREAWVLANMLSFPKTQTLAQDRVVIAALHARAASAQASDPLLLRLAMSRDLSRRSAPEQVDAMLAQLEALDPGNAINSLTAMVGAPEDYADPIYDQRLQEMVSSTHYASDYLPVMRAGYAALARTFGLAATPDESEVGSHAAEISQVGVAAVGSAAAIAMPAFQDLIRACDSSVFPARAEPCRYIGEQMFNDADTLLGRMIAVLLLERTTTDDADRVQALRWELDWQVESFAELMFQSFGRETMFADQAKHIGTLLRSGELAAMRDLFSTHGLPLTPPDDWQSKRNRTQ